MTEPFSAAAAVEFFEAIDRAMEKAAGGKYRAINLVEALKAEGIDLVRLTPSASIHETSSSLCHG